MKKYSIGLTIVILAVLTMASFNLALAAKPVEAIMVVQCNAQIAESNVIGKNTFSIRIVFGYFDSGPIEGTINRVVYARVNQITGKVKVLNVLLVTEAVVTIGDREATGEFEMKLSGQIPNVQWRITTSNLVDSATGESVNLNGQGTSAITSMGPTYPFVTPFTPDYGIENTFTGQLNLTP